MSVAGWVLAVIAFAVSARYFLFAKAADDGPVDRSRLPLGRVHPQMLVKFVIGVAVAPCSWVLSWSLAARGDRVLAALTLAVGAPAAIFVVITLFAVAVLLASSVNRMK